MHFSAAGAFRRRCSNLKYQRRYFLPISLGGEGPNSRCDCDGYRPDTLGGRLTLDLVVLHSLICFPLLVQLERLKHGFLV